MSHHWVKKSVSLAVHAALGLRTPAANAASSWALVIVEPPKSDWMSAIVVLKLALPRIARNAIRALPGRV